MFFFLFFFRDLINDGIQFEVNSKEQDPDEADLFSDLNIGDDYSYDNVDNNDKSFVLSPWAKAFDELKLTMTKLSDYNIYKRVAKEGLGAGFKSDNCRVVIQYNAYWEKEAQAFDSSYLMGKAKVFNIGKAEVLEGLELSVLSMVEGEESQFLISHEFLFGKLGCPPRIKPEATGLFIIKLIRISETGDEHVDFVENTKNTYAVVLPKVKDVYIRGKDMFANNNFVGACRMFHKAVTMLECCQLNDEAEQKLQQEFIIKLYTNLAVAYNKLNSPKKVCLMCNEIARISNIKTNCKVLFQEGRALCKLGEFKKAENRLKQAQALAPSNTEITKELQLLAEKFKNHVENEQNIWKRAFGNETPKGDTASIAIVDEAFKANMLECLNTFKGNTENTNMNLIEGLATEELNWVREQLSTMSMTLQVKTNDDGKKIYSVRK